MCVFYIQFFTLSYHSSDICTLWLQYALKPKKKHITRLCGDSILVKRVSEIWKNTARTDWLRRSNKTTCSDRSRIHVRGASRLPTACTGNCRQWHHRSSTSAHPAAFRTARAPISCDDYFVPTTCQITPDQWNSSRDNRSALFQT